MPRTRNPFSSAGYGYNNPHIAQAAENISALILGPESPVEAQSRQAKEALLSAQTESARAQAGKYGAEAEATRNRLGFQNEAAFRRAAMLAQGLDPDSIDMATADPAAMQNVTRTVGQLLTQMGLTGDTNFEQFQKGATVASDRALGEDVLAGRRGAGAVGQAMAAREGKPLVDIKDGMRFSQFLMEEPMDTTPVGQARIGAENAQAALRRASIDTERAQADNYRASAEKSRTEAKKPTKETLPLDISPSETMKLQDLILSSMGAQLDQVDPDALAMATQAATRAYQQTRDAGAATQAGIAALEPRKESGFLGIGQSTRYGPRLSVGSLVANQPQSAPQPVRTGSAPPAALQFYQQNRSKPGLREQFIQKYGIDPEA